MKYCVSCGQNVEPVKKFSIGWFLFNLLTVVGGGLYIIYFLFFKKKVCPMCGGSQFSKALTSKEIDQLNKGEHIDLIPEIKEDKFVNWIVDSNKKMETFNLKMQESTARMQEKNKKLAQAREDKKQLKAEKKIISK